MHDPKEIGMVLLGIGSLLLAAAAGIVIGATTGAYWKLTFVEVLVLAGVVSGIGVVLRR